MKNWTVKFRVIDRPRFDEVKSGIKKYETRAATKKYQPISEGDTITFVCGKDRFKKGVVKKYHFRSPQAMLKKLPLARIMPDVKTLAEVKKRYAPYPGYQEKIKEFGLFAFELR